MLHTNYHKVRICWAVVMGRNVLLMKVARLLLLEVLVKPLVPLLRLLRKHCCCIWSAAAAYDACHTHAHPQLP